MSRRDTIIIAVLVNAGLLMVLFATALKSDRKKESAVLQQTVEPVEIALIPSPSLAPSLLPELAMTSVPTLAPLAQLPTNLEPLAMQGPVQTVVIDRPSAPVEKAVQGTVTVVVKKGDVLEKIARTHHTSIAAIMKENQLNSTQLKIGQVLRIPGVKSESIATQAPSTSEYYVVKEGDNPWLIASKNHVKLEELLKVNGLDEQSARRLRPGDRLKIR